LLQILQKNPNFTYYYNNYDDVRYGGKMDYLTSEESLINSEGMINERLREDLLTEAKKSLHKAYATYSGILVGAAVLTKAGNIFAGCNVENSSYPLTMCAERNAVATAVAAEGREVKISVVLVVAEQSDGISFPISPCGACRQVITEFSDDCIIIYQNEDGREISISIDKLLPDAFSLKNKV